jgi:hypothetical protein
MKKIVAVVMSVLFITVGIFALNSGQADVSDTASRDVSIGKVRIARSFIHAGKEYQKGNYFVTLTSKNGVPYFNIKNQKKELLFEELAVVIPNETIKSKFRFRVGKMFINKYEYFKLTVKKPEADYLAFFLIKANKKNAPASLEKKADSGIKKF